jgi:tetratricopeptide (TPR) repeat protein
MKRCVTVLLLIMLAACASQRPRLDPTPSMAATAELARADALVRQGCYVCLRDALAIYEGLMQQPSGPPAAQLRAFDTLLLMVLRERELGLGGTSSLDQARRIAAELPAPFETETRLAVVASTPWKASGVSRALVDELLALQRRVGQEGRSWRDELGRADAADAATGYLRMSFECNNQSRLRDWGIERVPPGDLAPPLLQYRDATCEGNDPGRLEALVAGVPRFAEAHLFLGELSLRAGRLVTTERHMTAALDALPELTAARLILGSVYQAMEDFDSALEAFTAVVAAVPGHREALLGKAITLSYTGRHAEAIPVLDEMVRLGTWYQGEAFYWRAWNRNRLRDLDNADSDAAEARKRLPMDPQVDKLTGLIAFGKNDMDRAEREFRTAIEHLDGRMTRDCDVEYYLAATLVTQKKWSPSAPYFQSALGCYEESESGLRTRINEIRKSDMDDQRKARLVAAKERDITATQSQQARAAYNAAVAYMNAGDTFQCRPMAERAARHPEFANQAQALLAKLRDAQ